MNALSGPEALFQTSSEKYILSVREGIYFFADDFLTFADPLENLVPVTAAFFSLK